uniref:Phosphatidylinositol N-acetylglucosaminyltransferase subunit Q n=1 Tax=Timema cristinae TaxID=61476 RepID=A0A7R9CH77_TIMCR|nr:unnamed protein product [Timema cristinae]
MAESTLLIFLPQLFENDNPGYLYGTIQESVLENHRIIYILGKQPEDSTSSFGSEDTCEEKRLVLGYYIKNKTSKKNMPATKLRDWLIVDKRLDKLRLYKVISEGKCIDLSRPSKVICIFYNRQSVMGSELLLQNSKDQTIAYNDHFRILANKLCIEMPKDLDIKSPNVKRLTSIVHRLVKVGLQVIIFMVNCLNCIHPILKFMTLGMHLNDYLQSWCWALKLFLHKKKVTLKVGNFLLCKLIDVFCGVMLLYCLMPIISSGFLSQHLLATAQDVVTTLRELVQWLMGIPAGLKLNYAFNNMLGRFFLYHINLWWTFLVLAKPLLELASEIFLCFGYLGLTFQVSILIDLLGLVSFHVYCIYVYAARLYSLQLSGLLALFRLFLGKKYNPLRGRVDSCQYSPDQLFVGTLAFTILLFLLPTTFMYYIVFTTLRVMVVGLGGLLTRLRYLLETLPLYVTSLWLLKSTAVANTVFLKVELIQRPGPLVMIVQTVSGSWWDTVKRCVPDPVLPTPEVEWAKLLTSLAQGKLIYPV